MASWISIEQVRQLLRWKLNRTDLFVEQHYNFHDAESEHEDYLIVHFRTSGHAVIISEDRPVLNVDVAGNRMLTAKIFRVLDNEMLFYEVQQYQKINENLQTEGILHLVDRHFPIVRHVLPWAVGEENPVLITDSPAYIPLSVLVRDNDTTAFSSTFTLALFIQLFYALQQLHRLDIVHGDLKNLDVLLCYTPPSQIGMENLNTLQANLANDVPYFGHEILNRTDFRVVIQNLGKADLYRAKKRHNSIQKTHRRYQIIAEDAPGYPTDWISCAPCRDVVGNRFPCSRKSDILNCIFMLVHSITGDLPWITPLQNNDIDTELWIEASNAKREVTANHLMRHMNQNIRVLMRQVFEEVQNLRYSEEPNYVEDIEASGMIDRMELRLQYLLA